MQNIRRQACSRREIVMGMNLMSAMQKSPTFEESYLFRADVLRPVRGPVDPAVDCLKSAGRVRLAELVPVKA